jgi:phospholipase/lecithinase/hemolysin
MHRASNGPLWPEFLSTNLGLAYPAANNHAHCGAGASDVLNQVIQFPVPPKPELSLYFLMFSDDILLGLPPLGPTDLNVTNQVAWNQVIQTGILINSNAVSQLYAKGARAIVVQSEMDFGRSPAAFTGFGTNIAGLSIFSEYCALYNTGFSNAVHAFGQTRPDLRIVWVDLFSKLNEVLANPALYGFTKTTNSALDDQSLSNKSFTGPGADYVFWNRLHATSKLHKLISSWTLEALTNSVLESLEAIPGEGSPTIQMNHLQIGRDYTLQKSGDLRTWNDLQSFTASAGTNQWLAAVDDSGASYFRLKWEQ